MGNTADIYDRYIIHNMSYIYSIEKNFLFRISLQFPSTAHLLVEYTFPIYSLFAFSIFSGQNC